MPTCAMLRKTRFASEQKPMKKLFNTTAKNCYAHKIRNGLL